MTDDQKQEIIRALKKVRNDLTAVDGLSLRYARKDIKAIIEFVDCLPVRKIPRQIKNNGQHEN